VPLGTVEVDPLAEILHAAELTEPQISEVLDALEHKPRQLLRTGSCYSHALTSTAIGRFSVKGEPIE
jgi:hypothetical protein